MMLSKRILVCFYRGASKNYPPFQQCCHRNQLIRSRSATKGPNDKDQQQVDECTTRESQVEPIPKVRSHDRVPGLEEKHPEETNIEKFVSKESWVTDFRKQITSIDVTGKKETSVGSFVTTETSVSRFEEESSVQINKTKETDIENVVDKEASLIDFDNPTSLEVKGDNNNADLEIFSQPHSSVASQPPHHDELMPHTPPHEELAPHTQTHRDLGPYNPTHGELAPNTTTQGELAPNTPTHRELATNTPPHNELTPHSPPSGELLPEKTSSKELSEDKKTKGIKKVFPPLYHLARHVNESETLSSLVKLGVSLAEIEKKPGAADIIVKLNFERDVKPILLFLKDLGIDDMDIGRVLTTNPYMFEIDIENLELRVNYLRSKSFSADKIKSIVTRNSLVLSMKVERLDACFGFYQKEFKLSGDEVRNTMTKCPRLITCNKHKIKDRKMFVEDVLGFTASEAKSLFVTSPKIFLSSEAKFSRNFDYLHNVMELSHKDILRWPQIFKTRTHRIQQRHQYLASLGRAQYNPEKENFVSLHDLVSGTDEEFCEKIAKSSNEQYNDFLKML